MTSKIVIDFKNLVENLERENLNLCFIGNGNLFIEDSQKNLFGITLYKVGSYLDKLIQGGDKIEFNLVDSTHIKEYRKNIWNASNVSDFIKRQSPFW